jgi:hypothetical protein
MPPALPSGAKYLPLTGIMQTGGTSSIRDISSNYWFSALQPVATTGPRDLRVRQYAYQPGANIIWTPGSDTGAAGFPILREVADSWDMLRIVIETVKDRLCEGELEFRLVPQPGESKTELKQRSQDDTRLDQLVKFFKCPDGRHSWEVWLRMLLEDMLVLDAMVVYLERDKSGKIASLVPVDGATINRMLTDQGFTPPPPGEAYQQVLYGLPAVPLTTDDIVYTMRNERTWRRYGYGPVEQMLTIIANGLNKQSFDLKYWCYSADTEYLTRDRGWLRYDQITMDDELATRQIDTGVFEWQQPTDYFCEQYDGELIQFKNRSLDLLVTPEHRMLIDRIPRDLKRGKSQNGSEQVVLAHELERCKTNARIPQTSVWGGVEIKEKVFGDAAILERAKARDELLLRLRAAGQSFAAIGESCGISMQTAHETYHALTSGKWRRRSVHGREKSKVVRMTGDQYCAFMGMYLAKGSLKDQRRFQIAQPEDKRGSRELFRLLLEDIFGNVNSSDKGFELCRSTLTPFLREFGHAHTKYVPEDIRNATPRQLAIFWEYYYAGDGTASGDYGEKSQTAYTASKHLADHLTEILQKLGHSSSVFTQAPREKVMKDGRVIYDSGGYVITRGMRKDTGTWRTRRVEYHGNVCCFVVPNKFLYVRRNGRACWSGNTEGNVPEALCFLPPDLPIDKVNEIQGWYDSILSGNLGKRRRLTFLPGYGSARDQAFRPNIIFPKEVALKNPWDEWLFQAICYGLGTTPQAMLRMMNRSTAQQSAESSEEEGLMPKRRTIINLVNDIVQNRFSFVDIEADYKQSRETDAVKQMTVDTGYTGSAVLTINEVRIDLGKDPFPYPEADEPGVLTPNGFIPLTAGIISPSGGGDQQGAPGGTGKTPPPKGGGDKPAPKKPAQGTAAPAKPAPPKWTGSQSGPAGALLAAKAMELLPPEVEESLTEIERAVLSKRLSIVLSPTYQSPQILKAQTHIEAALRKVFMRQKDRAAQVAGEIKKKYAARAY